MPKKRRAQEPKILLVDPRPEGLASTAQGLRDAGFRVVALTRYEAAIPLFSVFQPDAAVIAAVAPDFEGCLAAKRLRQLSRRSLPIFYVVDAPDPQLREYCLDEGQGLDALARPVAVNELSFKLTRQLSLVKAVARQAERTGGSPGRALHDVPTGLHNKRFLLAMLGHELRRTERFGGTFSVVVAKLRGQEAFRREYGPDPADRLLRYAAMLLSQSAREADLVARVSEDSFALLLPGTPEEQVPIFLSRVAAKFDLARYQVNGEWVKTGLTLGSVSFPDVVATAPQLLELAQEKARRGQGEAALRVAR